MAFTERQEYKFEIIPPFSAIHCRRADIVEKDGVEIGRTYHRSVKCPGDDISAETADLKAIANALWTQERINQYATFKSTQAEEYIDN